MSTNPYESPAPDLDNDAETIDAIENPPQTTSGILARLGPGLIIAASIVGSGELIATTKTGASAGFTLLWLILIGCVIKVFAQIEIGRFTMTEGRTAIDAFDQVPGPRVRVSWLCWYWLVMYVCSIGQLGGIVGVVGQSLAISLPFSGDYNEQLESKKLDDAMLQAEAKKRADYARDKLKRAATQLSAVEYKVLYETELAQVKQENPSPNYNPLTRDIVFWTIIISVATSIMLVVGKYGFVQHASTIMVAAFTFMSVANLCALQTTSQWAISWADIWEGLSFNFPAGGDGLATALATFGIIGVGASELVAYPYWCLEKGYARAAGRRNNTDAWAERARGWFRVLRWDCWASMGIYTFATIAFYLTGATVLHRASLKPGDEQLIPTLLEMYRPVFGAAAEWIFLFGAFAVLYSTFFVASAGNARMAADALKVFRVPGVRNDSDVKRWTKYLCGAIPIIAMLIYFANPKPVSLVMISGLAQAVMLPMLGFAALYYRYYRCDARLKPGVVWTSLLWVSFGGLLLTGVWGVYINWSKLSALLFS